MDPELARAEARSVWGVATGDWDRGVDRPPGDVGFWIGGFTIGWESATVTESAVAESDGAVAEALEPGALGALLGALLGTLGRDILPSEVEEAALRGAIAGSIARSIPCISGAATGFTAVTGGRISRLTQSTGRSG